uniref:Uncharacterized protein n=1 Tax=Sphaerodactylus townsendi TaxID=933632 RepID=A0ACB8G3H5_9SAUR
MVTMISLQSLSVAYPSVAHFEPEVANTLSVIMALDQRGPSNPLAGDGATPTLLDYIAELVQNPPNVDAVATGVEWLRLSETQSQSGSKDSRGSEVWLTTTTEPVLVDLQRRTGGIQFCGFTLDTWSEDSYNPDQEPLEYPNDTWTFPPGGVCPQVLLETHSEHRRSTTWLTKPVELTCDFNSDSGSEPLRH